MTIIRQFYITLNLSLTPFQSFYPPISSPSLPPNLISKIQIFPRVDSRETERYYQKRVMKNSCVFLNINVMYIFIILSTYSCQTGKMVCEAFKTRKLRYQVNQSFSPSPLQANITLTNPWVNTKVHIVSSVGLTYPMSFIDVFKSSEELLFFNIIQTVILLSLSIIIFAGHKRTLLKVKVQHRKHHRKRDNEERRQKRDNLGYHTVLQGHRRRGQNPQLFSQFYNVDKAQFRQQHGWNWTWGLKGDRFGVKTGAGAEEPQWDQWTQRPMGSWIPHSGVIGLWSMWRCWDACHIFYVYV